MVKVIYAMRAYCNVSCEQVNWKLLKRKCNSSEFQMKMENGERKSRRILQCLCNYKENVCKNRVKFSFHCRCRLPQPTTTDFSRFSIIHSFVLSVLLVSLSLNGLFFPRCTTFLRPLHCYIDFDFDSRVQKEHDT